MRAYVDAQAALGRKCAWPKGWTEEVESLHNDLAALKARIFGSPEIFLEAALRRYDRAVIGELIMLSFYNGDQFQDWAKLERARPLKVRHTLEGMEKRYHVWVEK